MVSADQPGPAPTKPANRGSGIRFPFAKVRNQLAPFSPRSGRRVLTLVLLTTVGTAAETLALVLVARVAVAATSGDGGDIALGAGLQTSSLVALSLALAALAVKLVLNIGSAWLGARLSADTVRFGRLALLDSYFRSDWRTQSQERLGELQDYLTTSVSRLNHINQSFISGLNALVSFAIITLSAIAINPLAAVGCALAAAMLLVLLRPLSRKTKQYSKAQSRASRALAADVTESVRMSQEVRVFGVRSSVLQALAAAEERASRALRLGNFTSTSAPVIYQTLALVFLVVAVGAVELAGGENVTSLGAAVLLLLRGLAYGQQLQTSLQSLANSLPFLDALHERNRLYVQNAEHAGQAALAGIGVVELSQVHMSYDPNREVISDLSIRIGRAESIGIVGPSGSGKSTLLQLLLRLRPPTSGTITVDGVDLWEISAEAWAERVAFVPQDARLLNGTVFDNIAFHRGLSRDQVEQAARLAHIHDEILTWPDGYQTHVGESGNRISGGQRQRVTIARALAGKPDLLVLDEPTSALDLLSEAKLQQALTDLRGRVGLVIVAHRLSTIAHCERVLVLQDGRCQGFDTHQRLLETSPFYREAVEVSMIEPAASGAPEL